MSPDDLDLKIPGEPGEPAQPEEMRPETTQLLLLWSEGDEDAREQVIPRIYNRLESIASRYLAKERQGHTLETAALVHEAYVKLMEQNRMTWRGRSHFLAIASKLMRRILVDHARRRSYLKRGGHLVRAQLEDSLIPGAVRSEALVELDEALDRLAELDPEKAKLVEMRYFGGLDLHETAAALEISVPTVTRRWRLAKSWLYRELNEGPP